MDYIDSIITFLQGIVAQGYILMNMAFWVKYLIASYGRRNDLESRKRQAVRELVSRPFMAFNKLLNHDF